MKAGKAQFKGVKDQWNVTFRLCDRHVFIETVSEKVLELYSVEMTQESIQQNKNLDFFFQTPEELFHFLESSFSQLVVSRGELKIQMEMPVKNLSRRIQFKIPTLKQEMDIPLIHQSKIKKMQEQVKELRVSNADLINKTRQNEQEIKKLREFVLNFQNILAQKDEVINTIFFEIKELTKWKEESEKQQKNARTNTNIKGKFIADQTNQHNSKFLQIENRFVKIGKASWDVLLAKNEIPKNQICKYRIMQIRAGAGGSFMYGIGTSAIKGMNRAQDHKEFIGYYENTGMIFDQGAQKKGGCRINDDETMLIEIDTINWKISWLIEGIKQAETSITNELKLKPIYLAIIIYNDNSEIQFY